MADEDDVLLAADEVALGQRFDLHTGDGRVEIPVEAAQRQRFAELGFLDEAFDAALPPQAGLIGQQTMQELQVRPAGILALLQGGVELLGRHRNAQGREVGEDLLTQAWTVAGWSSSSGSSWGFSSDGVSSAGFLGQE